MRSLFVKIFLWFWLTVVGVGLALVASVVYSARAEQFQLRLAASAVLPAGTKAAAEEFERSGATALSQYLNGLEERYPVITFFFDKSGRELLAHNPPPNARIAATISQEHDHLYLQDNTVAQRADGPSGESYTLVLIFNPSNRAAVSKAGTMKVAVVFLPLMTLLAGGVFCYFITRHITAPLFHLRTAAARIARGDLDSRVAPTLGRRCDEIAALGSDFDLMVERIGSLLTGHKQLLANVSHELRSPLSRLTVALGLAKKARPDEAAEHLERIGLEAHRLDNLIGQLLTLSRIDSGADSEPRGLLDLTNLVHSIASDVDFEARSQSRHVTVTSADECTIMGSEELLRSAIENVVRNGIRFAPEHTSVEISLQTKRRTDRPSAVIRVADRGPGVPDALLEEIFVPFRRVHEHGPRATEGAGLGLAIAQRAIVLHGGTIHASNNRHGGLTVEIALPLD
jgi:two-component system, OmpR family, sensor histidine kinase CpxA